jgi:hypothetical protein
MIEHIAHPYAPELYQARLDHAKLTRQPLIERPYWYRDTDLKFHYHDIYACIGWPTEAHEKQIARPGYAAIVGIVRPAQLDSDTHYDAKDAKFLMLAETENDDVPALLDECLKMRERYGYGIQPDLLKVWYGDPDRFLTTVALYNERLGLTKEILISPPEDFYTPKIFDNYVRSLRTAIKSKRLYLGHCTIISNRVWEFTRDDPAVLAMGGLVHTLLGACMWMDQSRDNAWVFDREAA